MSPPSVGQQQRCGPTAFIAGSSRSGRSPTDGSAALLRQQPPAQAGQRRPELVVAKTVQSSQHRAEVLGQPVPRRLVRRRVVAVDQSQASVGQRVQPPGDGRSRRSAGSPRLSGPGSAGPPRPGRRSPRSGDRPARTVPESVRRCRAGPRSRRPSAAGAPRGSRPWSGSSSRRWPWSPPSRRRWPGATSRRTPVARRGSAPPPTLLAGSPRPGRPGKGSQLRMLFISRSANK